MTPAFRDCQVVDLMVGWMVFACRAGKISEIPRPSRRQQGYCVSTIHSSVIAEHWSSQDFIGVFLVARWVKLTSAVISSGPTCYMKIKEDDLPYDRCLWYCPGSRSNFGACLW
jgi:hypothetical protein